MDDDDFINIDDDVAQTPVMDTPQPGPSQPPPSGIRTSLRKRNVHTSYAELDDPSYVETGRTRYSSSLRNRPQPKLKLKLSENPRTYHGQHNVNDVGEAAPDFTSCLDASAKISDCTMTSAAKPSPIPLHRANIVVKNTTTDPKPIYQSRSG